MKIIMLIGDEDTGKTTTLNLVLLKMHPVCNIPYRRFHQLGCFANDFSGVADFNGKKIAFFSAGDIESKVEEAINRFTNDSLYKIDTLVCSSRSNFSLVQTVKNNSNNLVIQKTLKSQTVTEEKANLQDALTIFNNL